MIAQPHSHYDHDTLCKLLDDRLSSEQTECLEVHLSQCDRCRHELEQIAGHSRWWNETVSVLSETTEAAGKTTQQELQIASPVGLKQLDHPVSTANLDSSLEWIRPLLDEPSDKAFIGRIDHYHVQDVIGQGGMGVVLRGIDPQLNRPVAIKVLSPHLAGVGAAHARFMREAQSAAAVVHPSIVPIYSVATSARLPYIVMPCITGGNLQQRVQREGPLEISEVLRIGLQIAEGLTAAHKHGVIHRDIKPANILIEEGNGRVLISDFGLARALDDATLTISGMIAGTPQYMSPEQARGEPIDARSDLYSLGGLLYALATGRPPFRAESPLAVLRKISETRPRPIHQINERIPAWFDALVQQLMRTEAAGRVPDAESATQLLREALAHVQNPSVNSLPKSLTPRVPSNGVLAAVTVAAVLWVAGVGYAWTRTPWFAAAAAISESGNAAAENGVGSDRPQTRAKPVAQDQLNAWQDNALELELMSIRQRIGELENELDSFTPLTPVTPTAAPKSGAPDGRKKD